MKRRAKSLITAIFFLMTLMFSTNINVFASTWGTNQTVQFEDTNNFSNNSGNRIANDMFSGYSGNGYVYLASGWAETKFNIKESGKYKITIVS